MTNLTPSTQSNNGIQLTKPADWAQHMVTAALKFSAANESKTSTYATPDAGRFDVLNTLNHLEAHDEYQWPDYNGIGFDFSQAMRFRRALVNDVFVALQKAGQIEIAGEPGVLGTQQSSGKRAHDGVKHMRGRKRLCKRTDEDDGDTELASDDETQSTKNFLAGTMYHLIDSVMNPLFHKGGFVFWKLERHAFEQDVTEREFANMVRKTLLDVEREEDRKKVERGGGVSAGMEQTAPTLDE